ncbi:cache domain-containing protein [Brucella gallinifaecis]|uniref:cache domain-containing protein n=1 Tax=Brucella gallinifaecis TaxID=215590 RepID=UPI00236006E4|nr:cache domain-containing protein [Brucella gallinifaecis]
MGIGSKLLLSSLVSLVGLLIMAAVTVQALREQMIDDRVTMVRNLTEIGRKIIAEEYDRFKAGEISEAVAKRNTIETLRKLRYANDEYFFIDDFEGNSVLLPIRPDLEGTDASALVDSEGRHYVQMQINTAKAGGGVVRYEFTKPNTNESGEKMAYVMPFEPWSWFIATGLYLDDVDRETKTVLIRAGGVLVTIAFVTTALLILLSRSITRPLGRLTAVIGQLTRRNYALIVADQDRHDEIGRIARAVEIFKQTGKEFEILQAKMREQELKAQADREAALAFERDSALRLEKTARLISMGEMALSLAHELNQPLAAVSNYCMGSVRRLEAGNGDNAALLDAMKKASRQANRASGIVSRIRNFLRRSEPTLEPQILREIVEETASIADIESRRRGFKIKVDITKDLPTVLADRVMIEQVVFNLLRNAIEATTVVSPPRRDIIISARVSHDGQDVETTVLDFGQGIMEGEIGKIFDPFYTTKAEGMGVGLNICRSIMEFHRGRLWATPNPEGGTAVHFTLPVSGMPKGKAV